MQKQLIEEFLKANDVTKDALLQQAIANATIEQQDHALEAIEAGKNSVEVFTQLIS